MWWKLTGLFALVVAIFSVGWFQSASADQFFSTGPRYRIIVFNSSLTDSRDYTGTNLRSRFGQVSFVDEQDGLETTILGSNVQVKKVVD